MVFMTFCLIFNSVSLKIALDNSNATCFQTTTVMTLANFIKLNSGVGIAFDLIVIIAVIAILVLRMNFMNLVKGVFSCIPIIVLSGLFSLAMAILGTVILAYDYPVCHDEVGVLCGLAIFIVVLGYISILGGCGFLI